MTITKQILVLLLVSTSAFCFSNFFLNGTLNKTANLSGELKSPADSLYTWKISSEPPFKYRVLHKAIVNGTYQLVAGRKENNKTFFAVYRIETFVFHLLSILAFYFFLRQISLEKNAFAGALIFALLPPLLLAYNIPVHTREDTLAYFLLLMGLLAIIKNNIILILVTIIIGILCRETLLLLPFVNLFFNKNQNIFIRLIITAIAFASFLFIRWHYGVAEYNYWEGLNWNLNNLSQVIGFGFVTFGFLWIPFFISLRNKGKRGLVLSNEILGKSSLAAFVLIIATTFLGGIFNEIRILYLLAPWMITTSLFHYKDYRDEIVSELKSNKFHLYGGLLLLVVALGTAIFITIIKRNASSNYDIPYTAWIIIGGIQVFLTLLTIPHFYHVIKTK